MATEKELEIQQKLLDLQDKLNNARAEEQLAIQVSIDYQKEKLKLELQTQDLRKESLKNLQTSIRDLSEQRRLEQDSGKAAQLDLELAKQRSEYSKKYLENLIASGEKDKQKLEKAKKTVEKREEELKILEQQNEQLAEQEEKYKKIKEHSKTLINNLFAIGGEYGKQIQSLFTIDGIMSRYSSMISEVMQTNESLAATTGKVGSMTADMGMGLEQFAVGYKEMGQSFNSLYKEMADFSNLNKTVQKDLIIGTFACGGSCLEKSWTKMDLITYLNMNDDKYMNTSQHQASAICILKCKKTVDLVKEWYKIACNYHLIDDSSCYRLY